MKKLWIQVCLVLLSNIIFGCSSLPSSTKEMWKRSGYENKGVSRKGVFNNSKKRRVETVYVDSMLLPSGDYLKEAVVQMVIEDGEFIFNDPKLKKMR